MSITEPWLGWAVELQALAQNGLTYTKSVYERERYERIREIAAEMLSFKGDIPLEKVKDIFCNETGYQTPKVSTRAVVIKDGKILLVQENSGLWTMPGGWCDVDQSVGSNTVKEVREEAGMEVVCERILAVEDRNRHNEPIMPYGHIKFYVDCRYVSGEFKPNSETIAAAWFSPDELPEMDKKKTTAEQVRMSFAQHNDINSGTIFD